MIRSIGRRLSSFSIACVALPAAAGCGFAFQQ